MAYTVEQYENTNLKIINTDTSQETVIRTQYLTMEDDGNGNVAFYWHHYETDRMRHYMAIAYDEFTTFTAVDAADALININRIAYSGSVVNSTTATLDDVIDFLNKMINISGSVTALDPDTSTLEDAANKINEIYTYFTT
jgi:acyl carrier protein phosphodiesterase